MLRTLTINVIKCRHIYSAESFISKYKKNFSGVAAFQSKTTQPAKVVNGQYPTL